MVQLNRNNSNWSFEERRKINENWEILERQSNATTSGNNGLKQELDALKVTVSENTNRSTNALQTANQAKSESSSVSGVAQEARTTANEAKNTADGIDAKVIESNEKSEEALRISNLAETKSDNAIQIANDSKNTAEIVQSQFDQIVAEAGSSNPEVVQARNGKANLKQRLDDDYNEVTKRLEQISVNPINFGAVGDNNVDDTDAIQAAINFVEGLGGGTVLITEQHKIKVRAGQFHAILMKSNVTLQFVGSGKFTLETSNQMVYEMIRCFDNDNFKIINANLEGDKSTSTAALGFGQGIGLYGTKDYEIISPKITNPTGDGIIVGYIGNSRKVCLNGKINDVYIDSVSRNGISILSCDGLEINGGMIKNIKDSAPRAGIDVEAEPEEGVRIQGLKINNVKTEKNYYGIIVSCRNVSILDIEMNNCSDNESTGSFVFINRNDQDQTGQIIANNLISKRARIGIECNTYSSRAAKLIINKPKILDMNPNNLTQAGGISLADTGNLVNKYGNIDIIEPYITTKTTVSTYLIYLGGANKASNVSIINPIYLENKNFPGRFIYNESGGNVKTIDNNNLLFQELNDADVYLSSFGYNSIVSTKNMTAKRLITLSTDRPIGGTITIDVLNRAGVQIASVGGEYIYPLTSGSGGRIECTTLGGTITLKRTTQVGTSFAAWQVVNIVGTWTEVV